MAQRVFLHIGLPKTGTTYLQGVLWEHRSLLRKEGVLLPGSGHREHLWAALDLQQRKNLARRHADAPGAWGRLVGELAGWKRTGLVTHEFLCGASQAQAEQAVADLAPAEVHLVLTARHAAGMLAAGWQELVKNGSTLTLAEVAGEDRTGPGPGSEFSWRTWDLHGVLQRWGATVPPERVHVLPVPGAGQPPDQHWRNLAQVLGLVRRLRPARPPGQRLSRSGPGRAAATGQRRAQRLRCTGRPRSLDPRLPRRGPPRHADRRAVRSRREIASRTVGRGRVARST